MTLLLCIFTCVRHSHVAVRLSASRCITSMAKIQFKIQFPHVVAEMTTIGFGLPKNAFTALMKNVNLVVNYDLPIRHDHQSQPDHEVYLH
uniref:Uncharacterized protein n=1 Tax=Lactuca sativa TaxID=4236 RepID=A0A9R1WZN5_LACSA|nr:hypothetical protein LSAT_V11C800391440 [Lactuca sativa]